MKTSKSSLQKKNLPHLPTAADILSWFTDSSDLDKKSLKVKVGVICMKVKVKIHRFIRPEQKESLKVKEGLKVKGGVHRHGICQKFYTARFSG